MLVGRLTVVEEGRQSFCSPEPFKVDKGFILSIFRQGSVLYLDYNALVEIIQSKKGICILFKYLMSFGSSVAGGMSVFVAGNGEIVTSLVGYIYDNSIPVSEELCLVETVLNEKVSNYNKFFECMVNIEIFRRCSGENKVPSMISKRERQKLELIIHKTLAQCFLELEQCSGVWAADVLTYKMIYSILLKTLLIGRSHAKKEKELKASKLLEFMHEALLSLNIREMYSSILFFWQV